ncbi:MAG: TIGR01244 family sulfur transferase [Pseudomonadota bacterium]
MDEIVAITADFAVTAQLEPADFAAIAHLGYRTVVNNRPDGEEDGQLADRMAAVHAWRAGLRYRYVPARKMDLFTDPVVDAMQIALDEMPGPVLAYCKSGLRSTIVWAAATARRRPVDDVLADLARAGQDLDFLRDELDAQADREHWAPSEPVAAVDLPDDTLVAA